MRIVGVKRLKARLSEYLRAVRTGETFLVTDRDEVVAELRPAPQGAVRSVRPEAVEDVLHGLTERGAITRAAREKGDWIWHVEGLGMKSDEVGELLDDLRADHSADSD